MVSTSPHPLRLLSLDGGGVRGYSEIIMLEAIMKRVQKLLNLDRLPLPADYFDLIGGTSTGGLIAIMLGRLRMTIEETTQAYELLSQRIFTRKRGLSRFSKQSRFDPEMFTSIIQAVIKQKTGDIHTRLIEPEPEACKMFVTTVCTGNVPEVRLFRSYDAYTSLEYSCEVWEACRATSAAPTYFEPISIGPPGRRETFVDGGLGHNNPIGQVIHEAERLFESSRDVACIVSLGTGQRKTNEISSQTFLDTFVAPVTLINSLKKLAIDCERQAKEMEVRYRGGIEGRVYFRLSTQYGLEGIKLADWEQLPKVRTHTLAYLEQPSVAESLDAIAKTLLLRTSTYQLGLLSLSNEVVIATAASLPQDQAASSPEKRRAFYRAWLSSQNPTIDPFRDQKEHLEKRFIDDESGYATCTWLFETAKYQSFEGSDKPFALWIKSPPGFGKSVLASAVVDRLLLRSQRVLYYYCRHDPVQTTFRDIVCSLLAQCLHWDDEEILQLFQTFRISDPKLEEPDRQLDMDLFGLLLAIMSLNSAHRCYIIIDSIESCESRRRPIQLFMRLICLAKSGRQPALLTTSRLGIESVSRNPSINKLRTGKHQLDLQELEITPEISTPDVRAMVSSRVRESEGLGYIGQEQLELITESVIERAHGMFLYASLVLDGLHRGDKVASRGAIRAVLESLPEGLSLTFREQFNNIKGNRYGPEVFWWIFASIRELSWDEVRAGIAMVDGVYNEDERVEQPAHEFLRETCGPLIELSGQAKQFLRFVHPTVREALRQPDGPGRLIRIENAHSTIAEKLLAILMAEDVPDFSRELEDPLGLIAEYVQTPGRELYEYAVLNWYKHLKACEQMSEKLPRLVTSFLSSSACLKWLVTALVMRHGIKPLHGDQSTLAADVTDCLWSWMRGHQALIPSKVKDQVSIWSDHFLSLVLDWRNALQDHPRYLYALHFDLLPTGNSFREFVGSQTYQALVRFSDDPIRTRCSLPPLWTNHVFAVDESRELAYAYQNGYLQCYHTPTGILAAETLVGHTGLQEAIISPDKGYIALSFASVTAPDVEVSKYISSIQQGRHLTLRFRNGFFIAWCLENAHFDLTALILEHFVAKRIEVEHVVCLVQLNHQALSRKDLFNPLPGLPSFHLKKWKGPVRWKIDEPSLLAFSPDSNYLSTACGRTSLADGAPTIQWPKNANLAASATRCTMISSDFSTLATVKERQFVELWDAETGGLRSSIPIDGVSHLLAISNHGRLLLLLRVHSLQKPGASVVESARHPEDTLDLEVMDTLFYSEDCYGTITVYDAEACFWTDLAVLRPPQSRKGKPWAFQDNPCKASFAPEGSINQAMVYVPAKWEIADNVHMSTQVANPDALGKRGHLLIFHASPVASGFGPNPILRHMIAMEPVAWSTNIHVESSQNEPTPRSAFLQRDNFQTPAIVSWDATLESVHVYSSGRLSKMSAHELQKMMLSSERRQSTLKQQEDQSAQRTVMSGTIVSASRDLIYRIQLIRNCEDHNGEGLALAKTAHSYQLRIDQVGLHDGCPLTCTIPDVLSQSAFPSPPSSPCLTVSETGQLELLGQRFQLTIRDDLLEASHEDSAHFREAVVAFANACHPFRPSRAQAFLSSFLGNTPGSRYAIFEHEHPVFDGSPSSQMSIDTSNGLQSKFFVPVVTKLPRDNLYLCQFSRLFDEGKVKDGVRREAQSFEVFLCIYDCEKRVISWMIHTTTCGEIQSSELEAPKLAWALHPNQPVLAWSLPGQRPKISNIKSSMQPVNISHPITFEADSAEALSFSPNGRYLLARGADTICNALILHRPNASKMKITVFDLVDGSCRTLYFASSTKLSFDIDDSCVRVYRVTREDAMEMNVFKLPELGGMERVNLGYIPADCCCPTCGTTYQNGCNLFVQHLRHSVNVVLSHGTVHVGRGSLGAHACEPLILRTSKPDRSLHIAANDGLIPERDTDACPRIFNDAGELLQDVFEAEARQKSDTDTPDQDSQPQGRYLVSDKHDIESVQPASLSDAPLNDIRGPVAESTGPKLLTELSRAGLKTINQPALLIINNRDLKHDKYIVAKDVENAVGEFEAEATAALELPLDDRAFGEKAWTWFKNSKMGSALPFDSWEEMKDMMRDIEGEWGVNTVFDRLWPPGESGIGTKVPVLLNTFLLRQGGVRDSDGTVSNYQWSCAMDIGWIEEDINHFYDRMFWDESAYLRSLYIFPAMYKMEDRFTKLLTADTPEGEKLRKNLSSTFAKDLPAVGGQSEVIRDNGDRPSLKARQKDEAVAKSGDFDLDDYFDDIEETMSALSDFSPGLGEFMTTRLRAMFRATLEREEEGGF